MAVESGTMAPDFSAPTDGGGTLRLQDLRGKKVVIFFYPKDDTPGCTKEACGFRDNMERVTALGATVIGVSPDSVKSHDKFKNKHELNFTLVSDEDHAIVNAYEVWKEKNNYGRKYMGVERSTFLIDEEGRITHALRKVRVPGHVDAVMELLQAD